MSLSHGTFCSSRQPLPRSRGLNQAKPGRGSAAIDNFLAFSVLLTLALPPCYRVTEAKGVQKGSEALKVTW